MGSQMGQSMEDIQGSLVGCQVGSCMVQEVQVDQGEVSGMVDCEEMGCQMVWSEGRGLQLGVAVGKEQEMVCWVEPEY